MPKSEKEINAEKAAKPMPHLIPASATMLGAMVQGYGFRKHGDQTWKRKGTEQADPMTHIASAMRHITEYRLNPHAVESGSGLPVLAHAMIQLAIAIDCHYLHDPEWQPAGLGGVPPWAREAPEEPTKDDVAEFSESERLLGRWDGIR